MSTIVNQCFPNFQYFLIFMYGDIACDFQRVGVAVLDSEPHVRHTTYTSNLLCVVTISTGLKSWSRSIFKLLFGLLHACVVDLPSPACYVVMPLCVTLIYVALGRNVIKPIYALLFYLSRLDL